MNKYRYCIAAAIGFPDHLPGWSACACTKRGCFGQGGMNIYFCRLQAVHCYIGITLCITLPGWLATGSCCVRCRVVRHVQWATSKHLLCHSTVSALLLSNLWRLTIFSPQGPAVAVLVVELRPGGRCLCHTSVCSCTLHCSAQTSKPTSIAGTCRSSP